MTSQARSESRPEPHAESKKKIEVRLAGGASSGLASIVQQLLEQQLEESERRRARAGRIRGRLALIASDYEVAVTMAFGGGEIEIWDGVCQPDASIAGPYTSLLELVQGRTNPLMEHLRGRLKVKSTLRHPFLPVRLARLMRLEAEEAPE